MNWKEITEEEADACTQSRLLNGSKYDPLLSAVKSGKVIQVDLSEVSSFMSFYSALRQTAKRRGIEFRLTRTADKSHAIIRPLPAVK